MAVKYSPSPKLLLIGKGMFYFSPLLADGSYGAYQSMGNIREGGPTNADTRVDVFSSMAAGGPLYDTLLKERKITIRLLFEEFNRENIRKIVMGELDTPIGAQAATPVVAEPLESNIPAASLGVQRGGGSYFTAKFGPATAIVVKLGAVALVEGTDYQITQNVKGPVNIQILPGSAAVTDGILDLTVDYTPTAYAAGFDKILVGQAEEIRGRVKFVGDPTKGPGMIVDWWKVSINPTGQLPLISEDIAQGEIEVTVLEDSVGHPTSPLGQIVLVDPV